MKFILTILFAVMSTVGFACHGTNLTLISGPTSIGSGQYSTTVQVCFAQYTAGNWGGTLNFQMTLSGATYASFSPAGISNAYNAYTGASCGGPNCFMNTCAPITANATGSITSSTVVTYSTTSSTPAGYPIVPDDNESCAGTPTSFCFNFTFVSNGYPTSISLNGNVEVRRPVVCNLVCGHGTTYGSPCNGSYDSEMTIAFSPLPIELLYFNGFDNEGFNLLEWSSATESNNDYYTLERSNDGSNWYTIATVDGAGNSSMPLRYTYLDYDYGETIQYYKLSQTDFDGTTKSFNLVAINRKPEEAPHIEAVLNQMGQAVDENYKGLVIELYSDGSTRKVIRN